MWRDRAVLYAPVLAFGLLVLMVWVFVAWFVLERPKALQRQQQHEMANSVHAAAMQTEAVLRQAENAMRVVDLWVLKREGRLDGSDTALAQLVDTLRNGTGKMVDVMLVAQDGSVRRLQPLRGEAMAGKLSAELFRRGEVAAGGGVSIGLPLRLGAGAEASRLQLPLVLPLSSPVGEVKLVLALIDLQRLRDLQSLFAQGPGSALAMLRSDGTALLRYPELEGFVGRDVFARHPARRADFRDTEGLFTTTGEASDGRRRVGAYVTLADYGIQLLLSNTEDAALAEHRRLQTWVVVAASLLSLGLLLLGRWLLHLQRAARLRDATLQATSNAVAIGLFRTTRDGRIVYVNEAYLKVHGLQRSEIAWGWTRLVPADQREALISRWKQMMADGEPIHMVRKMKRGDDGRIRMLAVRTAPLIMDGKFVGQAGTVEDVTEQGEQEKAVQTLTAIFDMTPDFVCQVREDGEIVYLNPAARTRTGMTADAPLNGANLSSYYSPEQLKIFQAQMRAAIRDGHWRGSSAAITTDGTEIPVDSTVLVHRDVRGRIETISVIMRDVSEQVRVQRERQRGEALLLAVAHTTPALIVVIDTAQRVIFLNEAYETQRQVQRGDWVGKPVAELLGAPGFAQRREMIERAQAGEGSRSEIELGEPRQGQTFDVQVAPLRVQSGEIEGVVIIELDVTEARREEARLRLATQTDPLTQLLNRSGFAQGAQGLLDAAAAHGGCVAVLYLDLDKFKPVNDAHGHPTGDALLKAVALRLRHALRPGDLVARLGGDEFAVMLDKVALPEDAAAVADKLVHTLSAPFHIGTLQLEIGASVGWCLAPAQNATLSALVAQADAHLYEAKRAGRARACGGVLA